MVPQVQEGWLREVGRRYRRNLIVFIALALAAVGLKTSEGWGAGSVPQILRTHSIASVTAAVETVPLTKRGPPYEAEGLATS